MLKLLLLPLLILLAIPYVDVLSAEAVPIAAEKFDADVRLVNFTPQQASKVREALKLIRKVVRSPDFRDRVLGHSYKGERTFHENNGLSNADIYRKILEGAESLIPEKNSRMNVELELYHEATNTIGYTYPNTVRIWINSRYFERYTPVQVADNLFHEWMHKLGFDHEVAYSKDRDYSVPYAIGYLVEELAQKHYEGK
jgi:hypothetical protein